MVNSRRNRSVVDPFLTNSDEESARRRTRRLAALSAVALLGDLATCSALMVALHGWHLERGEFSWHALTDFHKQTLDLETLAAVRLVLLPLLSLLAVRLGRSEQTPAQATAAAPGDVESLREPLLAADAAAGAAAAAAGPNASAEEELAALRSHHARDQQLLFRRDVALGALFAACTLMQVFGGVKCVSFDLGGGREGALRGALLAATVGWVAIENALLSRAVGAATLRAGALRRELHPHELFYKQDKTIVAHKCDLCAKRITDGYRCNVCDFDCCLSCFARRDRRGAEGGLRGDRGLRADADVPPAVYFKRALSLARGEAPLLLAAFGCLGATTVATLMLPNYTGSILDQVWRHDKPAFARDVAGLAAYSVASGAFGGLRSLCFAVVGRRLAFTVRNELLRAIVRQDLAFFDSASTGDLTSRLAYDVGNMLMPVQTLFSSVVANATLLVGAMVMCAWQSWQLSLLATTTLLPAAHVTQAYARWSSTLNRHIAAALGEANAAATEALGNIRTVRMLSTEAFEVAKFEECTRRSLACGVRDACGGALAYALNNYLDLFGSVLILWYGGSLALAHAEAGVDSGLTAGRLVTFQLYWSMFNSSFRSLQDTLASFTRAAGSAQRVLSLMDNEPDIGTGGPPPPPGAPPLRGDVHFSAVEFRYQMRPDALVLRGVELRVPAGSTCALVGRSGGGKSTLCHLLLRHYDPTAGAVLLDGVDLRQLHLPWVHAAMGVVAQDTQLFADSIEFNIGYGCPHAYTREQLHAAARAAFAHDFIEAMPDGYATRVGERGVRLSGGQRQRLAIARVFLRAPRLLLLDEATSALDAESEAAVQAALDALIAAGGRTVLLVAHRLSTVQGADQIAVVDGGRISECGPHAALLARPGGVYARLVARQLAKQANLIGEGGDARGADVVDGLLAG